MSFITSLILVSSLLFSGVAIALTGNVSWSGKIAPFNKKIEGLKGTVDGGEFKDGLLSGTFKVDISKFDTADDERNGHMLEDLGIKANPAFAIASLTFKSPVKVDDSPKVFAAPLTLHGVTKDVEIKMAGKDASFKINLAEFGIKPRTLGPLKVRDEIHISVSLIL